MTGVQTCALPISYKENSVDFNTMSPEFYDTYTAVEIESLDLDYTSNEYKDKIVLNNKEIGRASCRERV